MLWTITFIQIPFFGRERNVLHKEKIKTSFWIEEKKQNTIVESPKKTMRFSVSDFESSSKGRTSIWRVIIFSSCKQKKNEFFLTLHVCAFRPELYLSMVFQFCITKPRATRGKILKTICNLFKTSTTEARFNSWSG